ncbi:conserved protein, unknown function [Hepatocystis sp. ex Piliocolobus tephrosceles]|nr:conserved protein, unknown function [Hepatocystis sp. ex Piliocolobus tephrosceles]
MRPYTIFYIINILIIVGLLTGQIALNYSFDVTVQPNVTECKIKTSNKSALKCCIFLSILGTLVALITGVTGSYLGLNYGREDLKYSDDKRKQFDGELLVAYSNFLTVEHKCGPLKKK